MSKVRGKKREMEKAKKERADAKRERRLARTNGEGGEAAGAAAGPAVDQEQVLAQLAELHHRYAQEELTLAELESARAELLEQLTVD